MQDSGVYNELDEKQMVRYSDIVKGSITKYEGLKDETEKNIYTSVHPATNGDEEVHGNKYQSLEREFEKNIYNCMDVQKKDAPKYISVIDDDGEEKEEERYQNSESGNLQGSSISLEKSKEDSMENNVDGYLDPVTKDTGSSQSTTNVRTDGYLNKSTSTQKEVSTEYPYRTQVGNESDNNGYLEPNQKHDYETPTSFETGDSGIPDDDIDNSVDADTKASDEQNELPHEYTEPDELFNRGFTIARQSTYMAPVAKTHRKVMENEQRLECERKSKGNAHSAVFHDDYYLSLNIDHNYAKLK